MSDTTLMSHQGGSQDFSVGPKYRFQNFGKCNLGEYPLDSSPGGSGYFPKLPKRVCAAQQGRDLERFRLLRNSVCRVASLSSIAGRLGKTLK